MKKLKKLDLAALSKLATILTEEEACSTVGGKLTKFELELFSHFFLSNGVDYQLSETQFSDLAFTSSLVGSTLGSSWVEIDGNMYHKRVVSLYDSPDYDQGLGTCTIYYDHHGNAVGMKDVYDFNSGDRELIREAETRLGSILGSIFSGSIYSIYYGIHD